MEMFFAVLLAVVASNALAVSNPGFEQAREQINLPAGWQGLPAGWHCTFLPNEAHLVRYETRPVEDSQALFITVASDHPEKRVAYNATQDVPGIVAGKTYLVSAKVQTKGLHQMPFVCVQCLDSSGAKFVGFACSPERSLDSDVSHWERVETRITVPEGTATFRLRIGISSEGNAGGTAILDDVVVAMLD